MAASPRQQGPVTGLLSALPEEQHGVVSLLSDVQPAERHAGRSFIRGTLGGCPVVLALSGIGKVAAASTTAALAEHFGVRRLVFTGVAGGLASGVAVGDVVVAESFLQHDMSASPLFPRHEVPLYGLARFPADAALSRDLHRAATVALADTGLCTEAERTQFGLHAPRVHAGLIASGDRFVSSRTEAADLRAAVHDALAVDMESAAVAQVCHDYGIPFAAVRTISDRADDTAHVDFPAFVSAVASRYAKAIIGTLFNQP